MDIRKPLICVICHVDNFSQVHIDDIERKEVYEQISDNGVLHDRFMMHCTLSGLNIVPVLVSNTVASSFLNENGRPKRRKGKYFPFSMRGTNGEMDLSSSLLENIIVARCS